MTNKEVIDFLKSEKEATRELATVCNDKIDYFKTHEEAYDIAIKSMEAWDTIREIFKAKSTSEDWEYIHDLQIWEDALEIIDKHLAEVEK